jgi:DNA-binding NtrC family response regulator
MGTPSSRGPGRKAARPVDIGRLGSTGNAHIDTLHVHFGTAMKLDDLSLEKLLEIDPAGGILRFAGERTLLFDAVALGLLRAELIATFGVTAARSVLTRFGYAHGWRTAVNMKSALEWSDDREWRAAGGRLHTLQGLVRVEPVVRAPGEEAPFAEAIWRDSYEAEQHLLLAGRSDEPVCWTLTGFASGYLSHASGGEVYCIEDRCVGKGDAFCRMVGRPRGEWGDAITPHLQFFEKGCLDHALSQLAERLKKTEQQLRDRRRRLDETREGPGGMVAKSEAMRQVLEVARRVARVDSTVLLTGESGVGKERIARLIHDESERAGGPFVAVNCAAVTETLLESELFGHARGAFTGATADRIGLFEAATRGTLFLDEVAEVAPAMQAKLLRVLQEREVRRVGENRSRPVDVRILAATNRDLAEEVRERRFRQDLYYRLRVVELRIPPLRERPEDVLPLARRFLADAAARMGRRITGIEPRAADQIASHDWPGNVRELENAIEGAVALATGSRITVEDLPQEVRSALPRATPGSEVRPLETVERDYILAVLARNGGNRVRTAGDLGIGKATLHRKLKAWRISVG